jgi:hypothetical protein
VHDPKECPEPEFTAAAGRSIKRAVGSTDESRNRVASIGVGSGESAELFITGAVRVETINAAIDCAAAKSSHTVEESIAAERHARIRSATVATRAAEFIQHLKASSIGLKFKDAAETGRSAGRGGAAECAVRTLSQRTTWIPQTGPA